MWKRRDELYIYMQIHYNHKYVHTYSHSFEYSIFFYSLFMYLLFYFCCIKIDSAENIILKISFRLEARKKRKNLYVEKCYFTLLFSRWPFRSYWLNNSFKLEKSSWQQETSHTEQLFTYADWPITLTVTNHSSSPPMVFLGRNMERTW